MPSAAPRFESDQHVPVLGAAELLVEPAGLLVCLASRQQEARREEHIAVDEDVERGRPVEGPGHETLAFPPEPASSVGRVRPAFEGLPGRIDHLGETVRTGGGSVRPQAVAQHLERVREPAVVGIHESDELRTPIGREVASVSCRRGPTIVSAQNSEPSIINRESRGDRERVVGRAVVDDYALPVRHSLRTYAGKGLVQEPRTVEDRHDDAYGGRARHGRCAGSVLVRDHGYIFVIPAAAD
jgi:hypothetical protein